MFSPQLQQGKKALAVSNGLTTAYLDVGPKALGQVHKGGGRTCMQSGLVEDHRIEKVCVISHIGALGSLSRPLPGQGLDDVARIGRPGQASYLLLVAQHTCEQT